MTSLAPASIATACSCLLPGLLTKQRRVMSRCGTEAVEQVLLAAQRLSRKASALNTALPALIASAEYKAEA